MTDNVLALCAILGRQFAGEALGLWYCAADDAIWDAADAHQACIFARIMRV